MSYTSLVPAVAQASEIILFLASAPSLKANLTEIAKAVDINKTKAYAILNTLQKFGFIARDTGGKLYSLGLGLLPIGQRCLENLDYRNVATPILADLAHRMACTALFALMVGESGMIVALEQSGRVVDRRHKVGFVFPLYEKAHGKVLLAFVPDEERERVLGAGNYRVDNDDTREDLSQLRSEIAACRRTGFSIDASGANPFVIIASPVLGVSRSPVGILFLAGVFPKQKTRSYGTSLWQRARELSTFLGADMSLFS